MSCESTDLKTPSGQIAFSIKITGFVLSPSLPVLLCFPKVLATAGHLLGDSRPTCHSFSTLGCSKQNQEVLDKKQMVREKKSAKDISVLHKAGHETC